MDAPHPRSAPHPRPALRPAPLTQRSPGRSAWSSLDPSQVSRRRFRTLNLTKMLPVVLLVGIVLVIMETRSWQDGVVLGLGLAAAVVAFERWTSGNLARVAIPCLTVTALVWPYGVMMVDGETKASYYSISLVGSLVVSEVTRRRPLAFAALVTYVAGIGVMGLALLTSFTVQDVLSHVVLPTGLTVVLAGLMIPNKGFYDVVAEMEEAREREAELAVIRERMRFASDLHDIQGHTLHVVKLKIALAQKLLHHDTARVEQELGEMYALLGDTIAQSKEVAYGQRRLNLAVELENARNLFEAAGIQVRVDRRAEVSPRHKELLGQVLRETTTNILRHSQAELVRIVIDEHSISVTNDGAPDTQLPELRGLSALTRRVSDEGGELTVEVEGGRFMTGAAFPPATVDPVALTAGGDR